MFLLASIFLDVRGKTFVILGKYLIIGWCSLWHFFLSFAWATTVGLEWMGVAPVFLNQIQQSIVTAAVTAFAIAALLTGRGLAGPNWSVIYFFWL